MRSALTRGQQHSVLDFFTVATPVAAYWAGYLMADGSIKGDRLSLVSIDGDHLVRYCRDLEIPETLVKPRPAPAKPEHSQQWQVRFTIPDLSIVLKLWGIIQNKSYDYEGGYIEAYPWDFLRGLIDGDGHIRGNKVTIVGNTQLVSDWVSFLTEQGEDVRTRSYNDRVYSRMIFSRRAELEGRPRLERKWS